MQHLLTKPCRAYTFKALCTLRAGRQKNSETFCYQFDFIWSLKPKLCQLINTALTSCLRPEQFKLFLGFPESKIIGHCWYHGFTETDASHLITIYKITCHLPGAGGTVMSKETRHHPSWEFSHHKYRTTNYVKYYKRKEQTAVKPYIKKQLSLQTVWRCTEQNGNWLSMRAVRTWARNLRTQRERG